MRKTAAIFAGIALVLAVCPAGAQQAHGDHAHDDATAQGADSAGMGHKSMGMPRMKHGKDMHDMHAQMKALHAHSRMMDQMTDQKQLTEEMKKHLRMMDEMMEAMMQRTLESKPSAPTS